MHLQSNGKMYKIIYSSQAQKDAKKVGKSGLKTNIEKLIKILQNNPYQNPPPYEKEKPVKIIRMWTHYE